MVVGHKIIVIQKSTDDLIQKVRQANESYNAVILKIINKYLESPTEIAKD